MLLKVLILVVFVGVVSVNCKSSQTPNSRYGDCGKNEEFHHCPKCPEKTCNVREPVCDLTECDFANCYCKEGYVRHDYTHLCVEPKDCIWGGR